MSDLKTSSERNLYLLDVVTPGSVNTLIKEIIKFNQEDDDKNEDIKEEKQKREPIRLWIKSPGGSVYDGFSLCDLIETSRTPVYTILSGYAMSMALPIAVVGQKRFAYPSTIYMYHESTVQLPYNYLTQQKSSLDQANIMQSMMDDLILRKSELDKDKMEQTKRERTEWYFSAQDALKYKMVDQIIEAGQSLTNWGDDKNV